MVTSTDKSGKLVLDTVDNYYESMKEHFEKDEKVNWQLIQECEKIRRMKEMNDYCIEYEKLFSENVRKQVEIAKCFLENMKLESKLERL